MEKLHAKEINIKRVLQDSFESLKNIFSNKEKENQSMGDGEKLGDKHRELSKAWVNQIACNLQKNMETNMYFGGKTPIYIFG